MADRYVFSGAGGAGTGADWANAHTTMAAAITASAAGDTFYVANDHAESQAAALTLTFKGTTGNPDRILCVNRAGSVPPVAADLTTGATVTTTGASTINIAGTAYIYGITFNSGSGAVTSSITITSTGRVLMKACALNLVATGTSSRFTFGNGQQNYWMLEDCSVSFGATGQSIGSANCFNGLIRSTTGSPFVTGATIPNSLFAVIGGSGLLTLDGIDLSAISGTIVAAGSGAAFTIRVVNCKLHASATPSATPSSHNQTTEIVGCGSTTNVARNERYTYHGTLTTETTIKRTGGATDGTTSYSWKIVTTANAKRTFPFQTFEGSIWNAATGSVKTLTVHTVTDNVTLTDAEIWLEVEYLGSSATPIATLITDANATVLTTPANQASSGETWTTTGLATPLHQKLEVTFTPQMDGPIRWRVVVSKPSTTVYVCPKAELT